MRLWCHCQCHAPSDDERDELSRSYGVPMDDEIAMHTARSSCCRGDHWAAFYEATERKPRVVSREKAAWNADWGTPSALVQFETNVDPSSRQETAS
ncbi:MAG TPA: hypothetical protein VFZ98_00070 [Vicinamibacterales bacterium]